MIYQFTINHNSFQPQHDIDHFSDSAACGTVRGRLPSTMIDKDHGIALVRTGTRLLVYYLWCSVCTTNK